MSNKKLIVGALAVALMLPGLSVAGDRWLHLRIEEDGRRGETLSVNVPLSMVESFLPMVEADEFRGGRVRIDDHDWQDYDLREMLIAVRDSPDTEFVTIRSRDESVRVAKERGHLIVVAEDRHDSRDRVKIRVPLAVVEAMVGGRRDEIDLLAGVRALGDHSGEDLVTIESDDERIRIWVDSSENGS